MHWKKTLLATVVIGTIGAGGYAALPAGAATRPTLAPATTVGALTAATAPAPTAAACEGKDEWPDVATGQPAGLDRNDQGGFYLWHNEDGWHLVVTHRGDAKVEFTGYVTTNGTIAAQRVLDEKDDHVEVGPRDHTAAFQFDNYGGFDGMNFQTHCADTLTVHLRINGREASPEQVFIGRSKTNPTSVPFTIERDGVH